MANNSPWFLVMPESTNLLKSPTFSVVPAFPTVAENSATVVPPRFRGFEREMPKLTKHFVESVPVTEFDVVHWDTEVKRFGLRVLPTGIKTYVVQYRNADRRTRKVALGRVGELTLAEARIKALRLRGAIRDGADPAAERRIRRALPNISELVDLYLADGPSAKPSKKASSWATDASNLRRHVVPLLGKMSLGSLTKADVQRFQRDVTKGATKIDVRTGKRGRAIVRGGPGTAARATMVLAAALQWAVGQGYRADNPAKGVELNKLPKRERFLSIEELASLGDALDAMGGEGANRTALAIIRLLVLTGARSGEIASLKWDSVNLERGVIRLQDSKTGQKTIPLGPSAVALLKGIVPIKDVPWVFPATRGEGYFRGYAPVWRKTREKAQLKDLRIHDLRHSFASVAVADGASLFIVGKILGHSQASTTERYAHLDIDPIRGVSDWCRSRP